MALKDQLTQDMKSAMKQREQIRLSTIRLIRAAIKNREIELREELGDEEVIRVISTLLKQHKDSIEQFQKGGRNDLVEKEQAELEILESYLPQPLSEEEVKVLVQEAIEAVGATSMKDLGNVMKYIMPKAQGRVDGKMINQLVKEHLA